WLRGPDEDDAVPTALLTGTVREAGGGEVTILVDRDTPWYPYPGSRVRLFDEASEYIPSSAAEGDEPWPTAGQVAVAAMAANREYDTGSLLDIWPRVARAAL